VKYVLFAGLLISALFVLYTVERPLLDPNSDFSKYYSDIHPWLIPHALCGLTALLIGPFQFSSRLRQRNLRRHRILGRIYFGAIAIAAPVALYLAMTHPPTQIGIASATLAVAWIGVTSIAFITARRRNIPQHRQWMVRSYALTTIFVTSRVPLGIPAIARMGDPAVPATIFLPLVATLVITEIGLHWNAIFVKPYSAGAVARTAVGKRVEGFPPAND
jgi:uncharacterized membrane protein